MRAARSRSARRGVVVTVVAAAAASLAAAAEPDVFYERLLRQGEAALEQGKSEEAATRLRVACFGLLEQPALLAEGLVQLAVALDAAGGNEELATTLDRLLEVEERFGTFAEAELSAAIRRRFELLVSNRPEAARLRVLPAFNRPSVRGRLEELERLPVKDRRERLLALTSREPDEIAWRLGLARLEIERGKPGDALPWLDGAVAAHPGEQDAHCLRLEVRAALRDCAGVMEDVTDCSRPPAGADAAFETLRCLLGAERTDDARRIFAALDPGVAADRRIQRLAPRLSTPGTTGGGSRR